MLNAEKIAYRFNDESLLKLALSHRSMGCANNERLEFLGDAVLGLVMAESIYQRFPTASEGEMSRLRSLLVNKQSLAEVAQRLSLGDELLLGPGELRSGGRQRASILADTFEAVIGAIYFDGGLDAAKASITQVFAYKLDVLDLDQVSKDAKTRLQELLQSQHLSLPLYELVLTAGKPHEQQFHVRCRVQGVALETMGQGRSRREAEQMAARLFLEQYHAD